MTKRRHRIPWWAVGWLFDLEHWLFNREGGFTPHPKRGWKTLRLRVSAVTRWLEGSRG